MAKSILIVDDSPTIRQIIVTSFKKEDFHLTESQDGLEALNKVKGGEKFDLFLVDVNMPNMDGITFIKEVRKMDKQVPMVVVTTESQAEKKMEGKKAGANGWLVKPFEPEILVRIVKELID